MSGGSKKTTVGYWYRLLYHFGLVRGPVDAFLEFRAGDRVAWQGVLTESGRITINKPNLWGGEKSEGGLSGDIDVMFGEADQAPNDYLAAQLGADQPSYRGKMTAVWRGGRWGAMNPYPKKAAMKVRRILKGWDGDAPWYPEKAQIGLIAHDPLALYIALDLSGSMNTMTANGNTRLENMKAAMTAALEWIGEVILPTGIGLDIIIVGWGGQVGDLLARESIGHRDVGELRLAHLIASVQDLSASYGITHFPSAVADADSFFSGSPAEYLRLALFITDGVPNIGAGGTSEEAEAAATSAGQTLLGIAGIRSYGINIDLADTSQTSKMDNTPQDGVPVVGGDDPQALTNAIVEALSGLLGMNPAHILYDTLTAPDMLGEPVAMINDASFRAAADQLFTEGFGLCTSYDGEPIDEFQQRLCDVIGASLTQSRVDGLYYLDLIRGDYDLGTLPIIGADDIVEFAQEPSVLTEQPNQVSVEWFDQQEKAERATVPLQALGAIQAAGRVIPETRTYKELSTENLALRVGARDLQALSAPTSRFRLTINRRSFDLRPGRPFRLQYPAEGIADMVCVLGDIDSGTLVDGRIRIVAVQDVFGFPSAVYVEGEPGLAEPPDDTPVAPPHQVAIEAPYVEMVANISRADLAVLPVDVGVLMTIATPATNGLNYAIHTAASGEEYDERGTAEWCPTATVVEEAGYLDDAFTLTAWLELEDVAVGTWALWDDEIVRVDAIDPDAGTLTLGRACADTIPAKHAAGSRIYFCGDWGGTDGREYVDGETVRVKLLTRTSADEQAIATAQELTVAMVQRYYRPYPPALLRINGLDYPVDEPFGSAVAVSWVHRDRLLQEDKLIDATAGSIGPEPGVQYYVRVTALDADLLPLGVALDVLVDGSAHSVLAGDITATAYSDAPYFRIGVRATRDGIDSWAEPSVVVTGLLQAPTNLTAVAEIY